MSGKGSKAVAEVVSMKGDQANGRRLAIVSGYYGFGNLGDEAILEELIEELRQYFGGDEIYVLSQRPDVTSRTFGVKSVDRWNLCNLIGLFLSARLLVSGGGGLFQDSTSAKSCLYYSAVIFQARMLGAKVLVYAQGLGPLTRGIAKQCTRMAMSLANLRSVRDPKSLKMLEQWSLAAEQTADPVWCLQSRPLPAEIDCQLKEVQDRPERGLLVGVSLRESPLLTEAGVDSLVKAMETVFPPTTILTPLSLQKEQDDAILEKVMASWKALGRPVVRLNLERLERPSQWLELIGRLDMIVGMRLHALLMALSAGTPVMGISYDPKVTHLLEEFRQPILNLTNKDVSQVSQDSVTSLLRTAVDDKERLLESASQARETAKKLACQNIKLMARILDM